MKKKYTIGLAAKFFAVSVLLLFFNTKTEAQSTPFDCDYNAYLFQYNDIYALDLASGSSYLVSENITPGNVNAVAYNTTMDTSGDTCQLHLDLLFV